MTPPAHKLLKPALLIAAFLLMIGALFFVANRSPRLPALPNPNGYDDFLRAGRSVVVDASGYADLDLAQLRTFVESNAEPLRLTRLGLTRQCSFPTEAGLTDFASTMNFMPQIKHLAQLMRAEGRLAELENRPGDAAKSYVDALRLGNELSRGGFVIQRLVGIACEAIGAIPLAKLVGHAPCEQQRAALTDLDTLDQHRVTFQEVKALEKRFAFHELMKQGNPIRWITGWWEARQVLQHLQTRHNTVVARERLILLEMALLCYQSNHGRPPERLDQLVPDYVSRVPLDPFVGRPLTYKPQTNHWLVYSVGPDGVDDGGKPAKSGTGANGDLLYDSPW